MANLKDIKTRIQSVQNTKKITRAMKMVAAAKVKKAETTVKSARPFADELLLLFRKLYSKLGGFSIDAETGKTSLENYPELLKEREIKSVGLVVVTSNKGLAGAYNANIVRKTLQLIQDYNKNGQKVRLYIIGQKGVSTLKRKEGDFEIAQTYLSFANDPTSAGALMVSEDLANDFIAHKIDKIEIVTTRFNNMMSYSVSQWTVLPVKHEDMKLSEEHSIDPIMSFEPDVHTILSNLVPMYITNSVYQALLEANASELASRMTAMSAASNNAEEMIRTLTIDYNKARQWAITQELVEIVSGADAQR